MFKGYMLKNCFLLLMNSLQLVKLTKKENIKNGSLWFVKGLSRKLLLQRSQ